MRKRVFISSVISGYGAFREAAARAITDLGHEPVMAERFGAVSKSPRAACLDRVRESDIYVGLFGGKYSKPTAEEYNETRERGKEILVFVEGVQKEEEQAKFLMSVEDYSTGHFRATYKSPEELHGKIVVALAKILTKVSADYALSDRRVADFGRELKSNRHADS